MYQVFSSYVLVYTYNISYLLFLGKDTAMNNGDGGCCDTSGECMSLFVKSQRGTFLAEKHQITDTIMCECFKGPTHKTNNLELQCTIIINITDFVLV